MGKKKKKNSLRDVRNLNAESFLKRYYGISHKDISGMTHDTLKVLFPQLERTSFEYVMKNPELVSTGHIILVEDVKHYQVPYVIPELKTLEDKFFGCDDRERVIDNIANTIQTSMNEARNALFLIECEDSLEPYAYCPYEIKENLVTHSCLSQMQEAVSHNSGIIVKSDYTLMGYQLLSHGANTYEVMSLPTLQRQAVGISLKTDAIGIFYENGFLGMTIENERYYFKTMNELKKQLYALFPIPKIVVEEKPRKDQEVPISSPSTYDLKNMSAYELEQLMKVYKLSNQAAYYHVVRRELIRRTKPGKEFKMLKESQKQKILKGED